MAIVINTLGFRPKSRSGDFLITFYSKIFQKTKLFTFLSFTFDSIKILGVVKRNPLFLHEIEWKNNGFLFTTPNIS